MRGIGKTVNERGTRREKEGEGPVVNQTQNLLNTSRAFFSGILSPKAYSCILFCLGSFPGLAHLLLAVRNSVFVLQAANVQGLETRLGSAH